MPPTPSERALALVLRINGVMTALALPAVFIPFGWMADVHRRLGMGDLPHQPIVEYLARSISFMYFAYGVLCLLLATDVRRFGPVITCFALIGIASAALLFWIDRNARMPPWWIWTEAPVVLLISTTILVLRLQSRRTNS